MAKRLDDTEDRQPDRHPAGRHPEVEAAEFEAEQPARDLSGLPKLLISAAAVAVSLYAWSSACGADRDQPGSRARQWTVPLTGGSAAVPMAGSLWVAPGWMGFLRLTAPTPTRSPLML